MTIECSSQTWENVSFFGISSELKVVTITTSISCLHLCLQLLYRPYLLKYTIRVRSLKIGKYDCSFMQCCAELSHISYYFFGRCIKLQMGISPSFLYNFLFWYPLYFIQSHTIFNLTTDSLFVSPFYEPVSD